MVDMFEQIDSDVIVVKNKTKNKEYNMSFNVTQRQRNMIKYGGLLNLMKEQHLKLNI